VSRVVVAGGAGFLGSHLCDRLVERGDTVVCLDDLSTGARENVAHLLGSERFRLVVTDVSEKVELEGEAKVDAVCHLASPASPPAYLSRPLDTLAVGSEGTRRLLELAREHGARFLMASTSEVYGDPQVHPQVESYRGNVDPNGPRSVYDEAKRFAEAITMAYHRYHNVDTHIVRIFNTYGPRMRLNDGRALPNFVYQALSGTPITVYGDGKQTRSFCFVSDLIDGIYKLSQSDEHLPTNIGNPTELTILEFAERVLSYFPNAPKIIHESLPVDDPKQRRPDITKAKRLLGWEPKVGLEEGLKTTIAFFKEQYAKARPGK
jgi:dTDP-glucose 4,6-dehydratase